MKKICCNDNIFVYTTVYTLYYLNINFRGQLMLKKLSKYGNSTTLVIDKAILELLNMDESSMVKLQTDGKSLIITPVSSATKEKVSYAPEEAFRVAVSTSSNKQLEKMEVSQEKMKEMMPAMQQDFKEAFDKHKKTMELFSKNFESNEGFKDAVALLAQKYDPVAQAEDYIKELEILKIQFFPELAQLNKDLQTITEKYKAKCS